MREVTKVEPVEKSGLPFLHLELTPSSLFFCSVWIEIPRMTLLPPPSLPHSERGPGPQLLSKSKPAVSDSIYLDHYPVTLTPKEDSVPFQNLHSKT